MPEELATGNLVFSKNIKSCGRPKKRSMGSSPGKVKPKHRGGGGIKGGAIKKKINFIINFFFQRSNVQWPLSSREGGYALMAWPLR